MHQDDVENIQWIHRRDSRHQGFFTVAIQGLQGKATGIHFSALIHEFLQACIEVQVAIKCRITKLGEAAHHAQRDAGTVEQN